MRKKPGTHAQLWRHHHLHTLESPKNPLETIPTGFSLGIYWFTASVLLNQRPRQQGIDFHCIAKGLAGIAVQPVLEFDLEAEILAQVLLEEGPEILRANQFRFDHLIEGERDLPVHRRPFPGFGFRGYQFREGGLDHIGQIIPVIDIAHIEVVLGARIGLTQFDFFQDERTSVRHLDVEVVVADKAEQDAVAIDAVITHHFPHGNLPGAGALVHDIEDEISVAGHSI